MRLNAIEKAASLAAGGGDVIERVQWDEKGKVASSIAGGKSGSSLKGWESAWETVLVMGGRKDKLRPGDVLGALTSLKDNKGVNEGFNEGLLFAGGDVGVIEVTETKTWVAVKRGLAGQAAEGLSAGRIKKKKYKVYVAR